jgi:predicted metal-dependent peptidase
MSAVLSPTKKSKRSDKFDKLIGPTDPKIDNQARERLVTARIGLLLRHSFFGNLATRLQLVNADEWCSTAGTDGLKFYYNSRFVMMLKPKEVEFLVGHEVLHVVYDHMGRRGERDPQIWNIADDYAVNADLKRHKVGEFIKTVPCLYEAKYDGKAAEEIYDDLMKNVKTISIADLVNQMIDDHMEEDDEGSEGGGGRDGEGEPGKGSGGGGDGDGEQGNRGRRRPKVSNEERERIRQEVKQAILNAAGGAEAGTVPANVERLIKAHTNPIMPWRELIQSNLTSSIRSDFSWMRPSRKGWHIDAIMPGMTPGEEIEVTIAIDMSGSISDKQAGQFLAETAGMMDAFDGYKIHIFCFDTEIYNPADFTSENLDLIDDYKPVGGGGTDFEAIFDYLKENAMSPKRLIVFTDGYPCGSWGDADYCDTTWIIHGDKDPSPPFGTFAIYDEK